MSQTINIDMTNWKGSDTTGPLTLVCHGATTEEDSAGGAVLRMIRAQMSNDREGIAKLVTAETMAMGDPALPGKHVEVHIGEVKQEAETWVVPAKVVADGQEQPLDFVVVKQQGAYKVDMPATIKRLMGVSMDQIGELMEQGMQQMADGLGEAMKGMGEAMSAALGGMNGNGENGNGHALESDADADAEPSDPYLADFKAAIYDSNGLRWTVAFHGEDENPFEMASVELLPDALAAMATAVTRVGGENINRLDAVKRFEVGRERRERKSLRLDGATLIYIVGSTDDGRSDFYDALDAADALHAAVEHILD